MYIPHGPDCWASRSVSILRTVCITGFDTAKYRCQLPLQRLLRFDTSTHQAWFHHEAEGEVLRENSKRQYRCRLCGGYISVTVAHYQRSGWFIWLCCRWITVMSRGRPQIGRPANPSVGNATSQPIGKAGNHFSKQPHHQFPPTYRLIGLLADPYCE